MRYDELVPLLPSEMQQQIAILEETNRAKIRKLATRAAEILALTQAQKMAQLRHQALARQVATLKRHQATAQAVAQRRHDNLVRQLPALKRENEDMQTTLSKVHLIARVATR